MLNSFYIRNFRVFEEFSIDDLRQINLITGKNNSGKSCLLEAFYLYARNAFPTTLQEIIQYREEDWELRRKQRNNQYMETESPFRHLFYGYHIPSVGTGSIELGPLNEINKRLKLHVSAYQTIETDGERIFSKVDAILLNQGEVDNFELVMELEDDNKFRRLIYLDREPRRQISLLIRTEQYETKYNVQYVPTSQFKSRDASLLWDNINIHPDLRQEVFKGLRLIDNRIQEIVKVGDSQDTTFILVYRDSEERLPLNSMGDGMTHLFHIILGLVNARGGILLIDEFENGLHHEIHQKVWELIFELAISLNVQVFATTHSNDTIAALQKAASSKGYEENIKLIKLKSLPKTGMIKSVELDSHSLKSLIEHDIEVR